MSEVNGVGNDFAQRADSVKSLFEFVREFSQIRKTVTKDIRNQKWHLYFDEIDPSVPGVKTWTAGSYQQDVLFSVERADVPPPP